MLGTLEISKVKVQVSKSVPKAVIRWLPQNDLAVLVRNEKRLNGL